MCLFVPHNINATCLYLALSKHLLKWNYPSNAGVLVYLCTVESHLPEHAGTKGCSDNSCLNAMQITFHLMHNNICYENPGLDK